MRCRLLVWVVAVSSILVMPAVGVLQLNPGTSDHPEKGYRSAYRHETESASPGYYSVFLDDPKVKAELTVTARVGIHRYTFPGTDSAHIILDMNHGIYNYPGKVLWSYVRMVNDTLAVGYRITSGWARTRYIYFAMAFSKPVKSYGFKDEVSSVYRGFWRKFNQEKDFPEMGGRNIRVHFDFSTGDREQLMIKCALSGVSMDGALLNLKTEAPGWDFDPMRENARAAWETELSRISITAPDEKKTIFYTALYHSLIHPSVYQDADGRYRGIDHQVHTAERFTNYTVFSLWDTYRALHPLLTWLWPDRSRDMINSMLAHFDQSPEQMLPVWSHHGNENWCMIGYHAVPVIADAYVKGIRGFNAERALNACVTTATRPFYQGIGDYEKLGYVPEDKVGTSASITLEYAYDDYTIAMFAGMLGNAKEYTRFLARSANYQKIFDRSTGFIRPKNADGTWKSPFDPLNTHGQGFIEGNAWNYSLYIPHDIPGMIRLMGGEKKFTRHLDSLFTMTLGDEHFAATEDVTRAGIIGNYVHGNEPSHHVPYLYNWTSDPWKTQEQVRMISKLMYRNATDGLCGNDDCGQMSAWYVFSTLGFYPVCPGNAQYAIGSPGVGEALIQVSYGKTLKILAEGLDDEHIYVSSVTLNGKPLPSMFIDHKDLLGGGELVFRMSAVHP
jgi:predicted alpha-1,2-mannosidase